MREIFLTFVECFYPFPLERDITPKGNLAEAEVIFAQSFGFKRENSKIIPGRSNKMMGRLAWKIFEIYRYPMVLQWEVADALPEKPKDLWEIRKHRKGEGKYLDSYEVASQTVEIMKKHGWKKIVLIAHHWHAWRKIRIFEKMGIEVTIPPGLKLIPFDKKSEQWWTRNWFFWSIREIPIRLYSLARGWI